MKDYEIKLLNIKTDTISFHQSLLKDPDREKQFTNTVLPALYPPVFLQQSDGDHCDYILIGRHWSYAMLVSNGIFEFYGIVMFDRDSIIQIIEIDKKEIAIFENGTSPYGIPSPSTSRATLTRHKSLQAGQVCPFCSGPLRESRNKEKSNNFKIGCENRSRKTINDGKGCDFEAVLTETEIELFRAYKLSTPKWLKLVEGRKCPDCEDDVFLRMVRLSKDVQKSALRCKKNYKRDQICRYKKELTMKGQQASIE